MAWEWMEGSRAFEIAWGMTAALACLSVAYPLLWWHLPAHRRSFFGTSLDPSGRLQFWYGIFAMAMVMTNLGCRVLPHADLPFVHPTFFLVSVALVAGLAPRVVWLVTHPNA